MDSMMNEKEFKEFTTKFVYAMQVLSVHIAYNLNRNILDELFSEEEEDPLEVLIESELERLKSEKALDYASK